MNGAINPKPAQTNLMPQNQVRFFIAPWSSIRWLVFTWLLLFTVYFAATLTWSRMATPDFSTPPGQEHDDVFYDNLAIHIANGQGFQLNFSEPTFRQTYVGTNRDGESQWILDTIVQGPTTSRSPAFPTLLAGTYLAFGRDWIAIRWINIVMIAIGLASLTLYAACFFRSVWLAIVMCGTLVWDFGVLNTAAQIMTEPLAIMLTSLLVIAVSEATQRGGNGRWALAGLLFGLGLLTRGNLNAWLLMALVMTPLLALSWRMASGTWRPFLAGASTFFLVAFLIAGPWWIRNCRQSQAWEPFGSASKIGWVGGYCDDAYQNWGAWSLKEVLQAQKQAVRTKKLRGLSLAQQEQQMGQISLNRAQQWIWRNLGKLPVLFGMKVANHFALINQPHWLIPWVNGALIFSALIGCALSRSPLGFWIVIILLMSSITTGLSWPHFGRYSIPIRPLFHLASAITTVLFWGTLLRYLSSYRSTQTTGNHGDVDDISGRTSA